MRGGAGSAFTGDDCYYATCKALGYSVNWGGGSANAHMEVEETNGYGPEVIRVDQPQAGDYTVGVHWYAGHAAAIVATVQVYSQGALLGQYTRELTACNQYWEAARFQVDSDGNFTGQPADTVRRDIHGSCF